MIQIKRNFLYDYVLALKHIYQEHFTYRASALAFTTLLTLVPMISVFVYVMAQFSFFSRLNSLTINYVIQNFVPASSTEVIRYLNKFTLQASQLPVFSILFLFIMTVMLAMSVDDSMNTIWHKQIRRKGLLSLIVYPVIVLIIPIFIGLSALVSSFLFFLFQHIPGVQTLSFVVPLFINTIIFTILYLVVAGTKINWQDTISGGFIASLLLELAKIIFAIYIRQFSYYTLIYGALAAVPVFLIWLYIFWLIILYGAFVINIKSKKNQ